MYYEIAEIMINLDYESLQQAELVSPVWHGASSKMNTWSKLLNKNVTSIPQWKNMLAVLQSRNEMDQTIGGSLLSSKEICFLIGDSLKIVQKNWDSFDFIAFPKITSGFVLDNINDLSCRWIACVEELDDDEMEEEFRYLDPLEEAIALRDRWSLDRKQMLYFPLEGDFAIAVVKVNETFIVASLYNRPDIFVWDSRTLQLVGVLLSSEDKAYYNAVGNYGVLHTLSITEKYLFSCRNERGKPGAATLWRLPTTKGEDATIVYRIVIPSSHTVDIEFVEMDDRFVVLFGSGAQNNAEIRKTATFEMVATIPMNEHDYFHYKNSRIVTGKHENLLRVWAADTGVCVKSIAYEDSLLDLRMLSDKFLITCNEFGDLKIWDLQALLQTTSIQKPSLLLLKTIRVVSDEHRAVVQKANILADDFQIVLFVEVDELEMQIHVLDFSV